MTYDGRIDWRRAPYEAQRALNRALGHHGVAEGVHFLVTGDGNVEVISDKDEAVWATFPGVLLLSPDRARMRYEVMTYAATSAAVLPAGALLPVVTPDQALLPGDGTRVRPKPTPQALLPHEIDQCLAAIDAGEYIDDVNVDPDNIGISLPCGMDVKTVLIPRCRVVPDEHGNYPPDGDGPVP